MITGRENWKGKYFTVARDSRGRFVTWAKWKRSDPLTWIKEVAERIEVPEVPAADWFTASIKYNFDRFRLDCSCTAFGTEWEVKEKLKKYMIARGWRSGWWSGHTLVMNTLELEIGVERGVGELKVEECFCASGGP